MGRYSVENGPSKVARYFSQLIDCKLLCSLRHSGDIIFWLRDRITKLKLAKFLKYGVLAKIAKFNARQIQCPPNFPAIIMVAAFTLRSAPA